MPHTLHSLTSARFFAAMWVLMMHFVSVGALGQASEGVYSHFLQFWLATGGSAVGFFFVLSGFILAHSYHQRLQDNTAAQRQRFWRARLARIYPTYLLALCLTTASALTIGRQGVPPWSQCTLAACGPAWLLSAIPVQSWFADNQIQQLWNAPGWSIATEAFFYALFPWLLRPTVAFARRCSWWSIGLLWLLQNTLFVSLYTCTQQANPELQSQLVWWQERLPLLRLPEFLMGICVWVIYQDRSNNANAKTGASNSWPAILMVIALIAIWYLPTPAAPSLWRSLMSGKAYLLAAPLFAGLIYWLATTEHTGPERITRVLATPSLVMLGQASYSLYILHWFGLQSLFIAFQAHGPPPTWAGYLWVLLLIGTAVLVHQLFERPLQQRIAQAPTALMRH